MADDNTESATITHKLNHRDTEDAEENGGRSSASPISVFFDLGAQTGHGPRWLTVVLVCLLAMSAAVLLYCHPYNASNLRITPDEIEYALGGHRIAEAGRFEILVDGQWHPSRYPPWFSLFVVAPAYLILGIDPGNAIVPVTLFGIAGVIIAFFIGKRISGVAGGVLAGLGVLALPYYRLLGRIVMTDVPSACLALSLCLMFIRWRSTPSPVTKGRLVLAGAIAAFAASLRVTNAAFILPFLFCCHHKRPLRVVINIGVLSAPLMLLTVLQLGYNEHVFGSPWRNGYHFWHLCRMIIQPDISARVPAGGPG